MPNGGSYSSVTCTYSEGTLTVNLGTYTIISSGGTATNTIEITGWTYPYAATTYTYSIHVFAASSTSVTHHGSGSFTISPVSITTASASLLARRESLLTPLLVSFVTPLNLYDGYQLTAEPFKEYSEVDINIYMTDGTKNWFYYDLGYSEKTPSVTLSNLGTIPCQPYTGFTNSTFGDLTCYIILGPSSSPTSSSYVTVKITGFTGVTAGLSTTPVLKIAIPIYNEPNQGASNKV